VIKTFKETITSLQDKNYGAVIIKLSLKQALWYWSKYFILVSIVSTVVVIGVVTYLAPQLPRVLRQYLPDSTFTVKNGEFSTSLTQPAILGPSDMPIIIDTIATDSAGLTGSPSGIFILKDKIIFKQEGSVQTQSLADIPDFYFEKSTVVNWISGHQTQLWFITIGIVLVVSVLFSIFFWLGRVVGFVLWGLGFWLLGKITKRNITYVQSLNLVLYASVLPYIMSSFLVLAPNQLLSLLSLAVFVYFGTSWLINLPKK